MKRPRVVMLTGAYPPELSGGGAQCRALVRELREQIEVRVLTTSTDPSLPADDRVDDVPVRRVPIDIRRAGSTIRAGWAIARELHRRAKDYDVLHLHGFSRKSILAIAAAKALRKRIVIKLTLLGEDDPATIRARGRLDWWAYTQADAFIAVSPQLRQRCMSAGLSPIQWIPNGVDLARFRPSDPSERPALRAALGLPADLPLVLVVSIFSPRKQPGLLLEAWRAMSQAGHRVALAFVGGIGPRCHEIDPTLARQLRAEVARLDPDTRARVHFIDATPRIEDYYRAADVFALPSMSEGLPNALLEAMASGLPCVASRLPGVTDAVIEHGANGLLHAPDDAVELAALLQRILQHPDDAARLGRAARATIEQRFAMPQVAAHYLDLYDRLMKRTASACKASQPPSTVELEHGDAELVHSPWSMVHGPNR